MQEIENIQDRKWSILKKFTFLFISLYVVLYILSFVFRDIVVPFTGKVFFDINDLKKRSTGSGDTTFNYVGLFAYFLLAIILTVVILIADWKRKNYFSLLYWFYAALRYYVGIYMLIYGFGKMFGAQFMFPHFAILDQSYGDSTPMRLLWTFMGYSKFYTFFCGLMEVIGGFLLFFRRTTTLGALLVVAVMMNVAILNFCYDVPVKIFSVHLTLFGMILLIPNAGSLFDFFFKSKNSSLSNYYMPGMYDSSKKEYRICRVLFFVCLSAAIIIAVFRMSEPKNFPSLYGLYKTKMFILNNDTIPPLTTDSIRWNKLFIGRNGARIIMMNDSASLYFFKFDTLKKTLNFISEPDSIQVYKLYYQEDKDQFIINGTLNDDSLYAILKKIDINDYTLVKRGFHWINEYPLNR
jgi:hypothetical protein